MIHRTLDDLATAVNAESWHWLQDNNDALARALQSEVERGATAADIRRFVLRHTGRTALAARCEQAAAYLLSQDHIRQYYLQGDAATARKRYIAEKAFCEEEYSKKKLELLAADPESKLNKLRAEAEAAERLLSPFISKLKAKLKAEAGEEAPQEKKIEVKTPEAKDARDLYNLIKREEGRKEARWTGAQFDTLYAMLDSLAAVDPAAKAFQAKLTK